jgi:hypothetical protein
LRNVRWRSYGPVLSVQRGGQYRRKFLTEIFGDMGTKIIFCSKSEKRVGVRNDVICQTFFLDFIKSLTRRLDFRQVVAIHHLLNRILRRLIIDDKISYKVID